jgi:hypothetical protein
MHGPAVQLIFFNPLNVSVQVGDFAYFANPTAVGVNRLWADTTTPHMTAGQGDIIMIGRIDAIQQWDGNTSSITCDMPQNLFNLYFDLISTTPGERSFIMFSKDNKVNLSSLTGYYANVEMRNDSKHQAELFNVGADFFESSK